MKICVCTVLSDGYVVFLDHFIKSILKHNPEFDKDFIIFHDDRLSWHSKKHLRTLYKNFIFLECHFETYEENYKGSIKYYSFESFKLDQYDRVIYWGADMLCMGSLDSLWATAEGVEGIAMPVEKQRLTERFNNGSMIIGPDYLGIDVYDDLMRSDYSHIHCQLQDQKVLNYFFMHKIKEIDQRFNVLVSETKHIKREDILILHYIYKPTIERGRASLEKWQLDEWEQYDDPEGRYTKLKEEHKDDFK